MENPGINLINEIKNLSYDDRKKLYIETFSLGVFGDGDMNSKFILLSLVSLVYQKVKNNKITPLDVLLKITNKSKDNSYFYRVLENISIMVEDLSYSTTTIDSCGLKTSDEIIKKIKEILSTWTPF